MEIKDRKTDVPLFIVRYLPQFHRVKENDEWWGDGYTEWTAVRNAESLFFKHEQPRIPLDERYYDLLDKGAMLWQANLAKKYGVGGFSFYHYWFKDGRRILEKPAENLLKWQDVNMPFCFTWANETWARTWSKMRGGNAWGERFETNAVIYDNDTGVLLEQKYGEKKDWLQHIRYLIPFFKDRRYIKKDGKPVLIIYKPDRLYCWPDMRECWEEELDKAGISGLYVIGEVMTWNTNLSCDYDARMFREPNCSWHIMQSEKLSNGVRKYNYKDYWQDMLSRNWTVDQNDMPSYLCIADEFDNTPRNGNFGVVMQRDTVSRFRDNLCKTLDKVRNLGQEYVFYNAWNEWGEGMYLEPDTKEKYSRLEAVRDALSNCSKIPDEQNKEQNESSIYVCKVGKRADSKSADMVFVLDRWLLNREEGKNIADYMCKHGWSRIAIYGAGILGRHLLTELADNHVKVMYIIDRDTNVRIRGCHIYQLTKELPPVDVIVVTPVNKYGEIRREIKKILKYKVVSLEHILFEM